MSLAFVLDEHLRGPLWQAILRYNLSSGRPLDVIRVGDLNDLPLSASDSEILLWAERERRILITQDRHTMAVNLQHHLKEGHHSPGILIARRFVRIPELIECLELISLVGEAAEITDAIYYIP
jgi:Domain of unknown function (DUF5615)